MENTEEKVWQIPNRFEAMAEAAKEVFGWLASHPISSRAKYSTGLAVEEMITNMIKYGYDDSDEHQIRFRIAIHPDHLEIVFEDDGHAFDPTRHPSPNVVNVINSPRIGGLGIELVRRVTTRMTYEREGNLNRNTLHIRRIEPGDTQPIRVTLPNPPPL
jgi:anti-sigma regulatory factor (Ser/Thr protein kinase)